MFDKGRNVLIDWAPPLRREAPGGRVSVGRLYHSNSSELVCSQFFEKWVGVRDEPVAKHFSVARQVIEICGGCLRFCGFRL